MGRKGDIRQIAAGVAGSMSALCAGSSFVWITPLLPYLQEKNTDIFLTNEAAAWTVAVIEIGNMVSPMPFAILVNYLGRKWCLYSIGPIYSFAWILILTTRNVYILYASRMIQGFALGIVYTVLPIYLAEIAEIRLRGTLSVLFFLMFFLGIMEIYAVGKYLSYQNLTWVCFVNPVVFSLSFGFFPESPWYLVMKNRDIPAGQALMWLRGSKSLDEVLPELEDMKRTINGEIDQGSKWQELFTTKVGLKSLMLVQLVGMTQTMGGFTAMLTYSTDSFEKTNLDWIDSHTNTLLYGISALISAIFVSFMADRLGRRKILLISTGGCFILMLVLGIFFYFHEKAPICDHRIQWIPFISSILFAALMNFGLVALLTTLTSEYFPTKKRGIASGVTSVALCVMSFVVLRIYLPIQESVGLYVNYLVYASFLFLGLLLIAIFIPETNQKSFQEIQNLLTGISTVAS